MLRYRVKMKQKDYKNPSNSKQIVLANHTTQTARLQGKYALGVFQLKSQLDFTQYNLAHFQPEYGYAFSQQCTLQLTKPAIQCTVAGVYFHTDSYASRIYNYEKGLLYSLSFPSFFGHGFRFSAVFRCDISSHWMVMAKYGHTQYLDSAKPQKNDLQLQLRVKF